MRLALFNEYVKTKLLAVADTKFASVIIMFQRINTIKSLLQDLVFSNQWTIYRDNNVRKAQFVLKKKKTYIIFGGMRTSTPFPLASQSMEL